MSALPRTHQALDQRSLMLHRLVADKVRANPALLDQAQATLRRWRATASPRTFSYLDEWQRLLDAGLEVCLQTAVDEGERATALRQASPLACLLDNAERFRFLKSWTQAQSGADPVADPALPSGRQAHRSLSTCQSGIRQP